MSLSCCSSLFRPPQVLDARLEPDEVVHVYDKLARIYDVWGYLTESKARARAIELARISNRTVILEVAVGTGLAFYELVKMNPDGKNFGIDISEGMLARARARLSGLSDVSYQLSIGEARNLDAFRQGSVDVLLNNYMFDLLPFSEMDAVISEFHRVLKPGGKLVLVNMTKGERVLTNLYEWIYNLSPATMGGCRGVTMSDRLKAHGFSIQRREYWQQLLFPSEVILAIKDKRAGPSSRIW